MRTMHLRLPLAGLAPFLPARAFALWAERQATRRALERLDTRLLDDIGLTAREARAESGKPFWQD